jgi:hypothetical protein
LPTEVVHALVVRDAHDPLNKLALLVVSTGAQRFDDLDKSVLENVVRHGMVFDHQKNGSENLGFVAVQKSHKGSFIAIEIPGDEFAVIECLALHGSTDFLNNWM